MKVKTFLLDSLFEKDIMFAENVQVLKVYY